MTSQIESLAQTGEPALPAPPSGPWRLPPLRLPADLGRLDAVTGYVYAVARRAGLGSAARYRLRLAVEELTVNAVLHGYAQRPGELGLTGGGDGRGGGWITVEDAAPAFDPARRCPDPPAPLPLPERPIGGLGIRLALAAADEYTYEYTGGRNRSTVAVRRRPGEEA